MRYLAIATNCWILTFLMATPTVPGQAPSVAGRSVGLEVTRDTWVSDVGRERDGNNGGAARLKLKSIQEMTLLDVDPAPLRGRTIRSATLHVRRSGTEPLRRVTVGSVGAEWFEGTGSGYAVQPGGATFRRRRHPDLPWSSGGGDLCRVILGNGGTTWGMADASPPDREGWQRVRVDPRVVAARLAGLSHGFLVFDDTGSEWTRDGETFTQRIFPNRFVFSREQNRASAPYFRVELGPDDHQPPEAPSGLRAESLTSLLPAGEAMISWVTPRDSGPAGTLGFLVEIEGRSLARELIPMAGAAGERVAMRLRDVELAPGATVTLSVKAVDGAGNLQAWAREVPSYFPSNPRVGSRLARVPPIGCPRFRASPGWMNGPGPQGLCSVGRLPKSCRPAPRGSTRNRFVAAGRGLWTAPARLHWMAVLKRCSPSTPPTKFPENPTPAAADGTPRRAWYPASGTG